MIFHKTGEASVTKLLLQVKTKKTAHATPPPALKKFAKLVIPLLISPLGKVYFFNPAQPAGRLIFRLLLSLALS
jgi:hypothetical protein